MASHLASLIVRNTPFRYHHRSGWTIQRFVVCSLRQFGRARFRLEWHTDCSDTRLSCHHFPLLYRQGRFYRIRDHLAHAAEAPLIVNHPKPSSSWHAHARDCRKWRKLVLDLVFITKKEVWPFSKRRTPSSYTFIAQRYNFVMFGRNGLLLK